MAETYVDQDTGETFVKTPDGQLVLSVGAAPQAAYAGIGSGAKDVMLIPKGAFDAVGGFLSAVGADFLGDSLQEVGATIGRGREAMRSEYELSAQTEFPLSFMAGQMAGSYRPGGPGMQSLMGGLEGIGLAETPGEAVMFGSLGAGGGLIGGRQGNKALQGAQAAIAKRSGSAARAGRAAAAERLKRLNIPLEESDLARRGAVGPTRRDRLRQLLNPDSAIRDKRTALNELVTENINPRMGAQDAITSGWLTDNSKRIDEMYAGVRERLPALTATTGPQGDRALAAAVRMEQLAGEISPSRSQDVAYWSKKVIDTWQGDALTPQRWSTLRSRIGASARSADNAETMGSLYQVRELLDEMVMGGDPAIREALQEANSAWRLQEVLIRPHVIDQTGDINPNQFLRNMEKMFPDSWRTDYTANPLAGELVDTMKAAEMFPAFRTSGTGEMLTASSITKQFSARAQLALGSPGAHLGGTLGRSLVRPFELTYDAFRQMFQDAPSGDAQPDPAVDE